MGRMEKKSLLNQQNGAVETVAKFIDSCKCEKEMRIKNT